MKSGNVKIDPRIKRTRKMFKEAFISLIQEDADQNKLTVQHIADRAELRNGERKENQGGGHFMC